MDLGLKIIIIILKVFVIYVVLEILFGGFRGFDLRTNGAEKYLEI